MANTEQLKIAREGRKAWNKWRLENADEEVDLSGVDFTLDVNQGISFIGFEFGDRARFKGATFGYGAWFEGATFGDGARFEGATFGDYAWFEGATFGDNVRFDGATFKGRASFDAAEASVNPDVSEAGTYFHTIVFLRAQFLGPASFTNRDFKGEAIFSATGFDMLPDFRGTKHRENLDWTRVRFAFGWYPKLGLLRIPIRGWTTKSEIITRLRRLRGVAKEIHAVDAERDLFILERQAERGIFWRDWLGGGWRTWFTGWWRPLRVTFLMFLYRYSSNCGRSVLLPAVWLVVSNIGFYFLYASLIERPIASVERALFDLTFASAIPFGATARPAFQSAVKKLFEQGDYALIEIPWQFQAASAVQGITNLVLLFLFGLALRNYFKFR